MKTLFKNVTLIGEGETDRIVADVAVDGKNIVYVGADAEGNFDRTLDCSRYLMIPGMYNAHCHAAMTMFRGYAEDLPLLRWLEEKIFPAEELWKTRPELIRDASMSACAEMIRGGIVSFTDMYELCGLTADAVIECGMKANISRAVLSFDKDEEPDKNDRFNEAKLFAGEYHNAADGRIKVDMALHAEYTNTPRMTSAVADFAVQRGLRLHIHLSETASEHTECIARHGLTPLGFFEKYGALAVPVTAAHCVWVSDEDIALMKRRGVTAAHNPTSNLKLGSGVMPLRKLLDAGVNVALGTDGVSSNNNHDLLFELRLASILHKGISGNADETTARELYPLIAENGAESQGRDDCGKIEAGRRADIVLIDLDAPNNVPVWNAVNALCYSVSSANVVFTMCDGKVLYENGEYTTLDIERVTDSMKRAKARYFD